MTTESPQPPAPDPSSTPVETTRSNVVVAGLRITWDALVYRVRKRELNNLPVIISLMVAFELPWLDVAYRSAYALVLNIFIYLLNDVCDIEVDLASPQKDQRKTRFLADNRGAGIGALVSMALLLAAGGIAHSRLLAIAFFANAIIIFFYSLWLKRKPIVDILMMVLWGAGMPLVGAPGTALGWRLIGLLALLCSCYEAIQVVRDEPDDRDAGVVSTAVLLGAARVAWVFRGLIVVSIAYGVLVVPSLVPIALVAALFFPVDPDRANRTWDLTRGLFGLVWLALLVQVYLGYLPA